MVFLEGEKLIFWTFVVLFEYAGRIGKGGAVLFVRIVTACNRAERPTCGAASFGLQAVGFVFGQYPRFTDLEPSFPALTAFPQGRYTERPERGRLCQCKEWFFIIFWR